MRKRVVPIGATRVAPNGYHYTKVSDEKGQNNWRATHYILAEEMLGRPIRADERVTFIDTSLRSTPTKKNILVVKKRAKTKAAIVAEIRNKIEELKGQLVEMGEEPCC